MGWNEKWTLRFAVVALIFLAMTGFEGVLMRTHMAAPEALAGFERALNAVRITDREPTKAELFFGMMTVHPIVGVYGFAYMAVMGAFYFLVPYLLKKEIRHKKLVPVNFWLQTGGVLLCWASGFFAMFNSLHPLLAPARLL
ncbi:MAG: cbb3-type cytochrome c oxidase subunit I [Anaerolineae bacterium]